jgi:tungstate transport system ATP-binding protein
MLSARSSRAGIKSDLDCDDLREAKRLAGDIVLMHRGRVIESGPVDAFFCAPRSDDARRFIAGELLV